MRRAAWVGCRPPPTVRRKTARECPDRPASSRLAWWCDLRRCRSDPRERTSRHGALPVRGEREDGKVRRQMRPADGSEHLPFVWCNLVRGAHFSERTQGIQRRIPDELLGNLLLAHGRDLGWIHFVHVVAATGNDRHPGSRGHLSQKTYVPAAVGMGAVHDADDAVPPGSGELLDHETEVRASFPRAGRTAGNGVPPGRWCRCTGPRRPRGHPRVPIEAVGHMFVKQGCAAGERGRRQVVEHRPNDGARRKLRILRAEDRAGRQHRRRARSQQAQRFPAGESRRTRMQSVCHDALRIG